MNSAYFQVQEEDSLEQCSLDSGTSDMSSGMTTASESLPLESVTDTCQTPPSLAISKHSSVTGTPQAIKIWLMSLQRDFLASPSVSPGSKREPTTKEICGRRRQSVLELSNPDSFCLKTCRESISTCPWLSETCADLGMKFQDPSSLGLTTLGRRTGGSGCGFLRTPSATEADHGGPNARDSKGGLHLSAQVMLPTPRSGKMTNENEETWRSRKVAGKVATPPLGLAINMAPTPSASMVTMQDFVQAKFHSSKRPKYADAMLPTASCRDHKGGSNWANRKRDGQPRNASDMTLPDVIEAPGQSNGLKLQPAFVEWLMGWPIGWTDLKPLATDKFREWRQQHGIF